VGGGVGFTGAFVGGCVGRGVGLSGASVGCAGGDVGFAGAFVGCAGGEVGFAGAFVGGGGVGFRASEARTPVAQTNAISTTRITRYRFTDSLSFDR
jgi:hypothetical protein